MTHTFINQLQAGMHIQNGIYRLTNLEHKVAKNRKEYVTYALADISGIISGQFWGDKDCGAFMQGLKNESFVNATFDVSDKGNATELKNIVLNTLDPQTVPQELKGILVPRVDGDIEQMANELCGIMNTLSDSRCIALFNAIMQERWQLFKQYPAAQYAHQAVVGGLLQHSLEVTKNVVALANGNIGCSKDILVVAAAIHDACKIEEFDLGDTGLVSQYSRKGVLKGHIQMGSELVGKVAPACGFTDEEVDILQHLILSHHGKKEFGSPVEPEFFGAELLHKADDISAKQHEYEDALKDVQPGCISDKAFFLDGRKLYKPTNTVVAPPQNY